MADATNQRLNTSTQVRNMYSEGISYINVKYFNMNISFQFHPFLSKDANGRSSWNSQKALVTTVGWDGAFLLYKTGKDIIEGKIPQKTVVTIPCAGGASLVLERKDGADGQMETWFTISKNNEIIPFKFATHTIQVEENGQMVPKVIDSGLGAFVKTLDSYLIGTNTARHLDKVTEDFAKIQEAKSGNQGYNRGGGYQRPPNRNFQGGRKPYYGNQQYQQQPPAQQNMSSYNIPQ